MKNASETGSSRSFRRPPRVAHEDEWVSPSMRASHAPRLPVGGGSAEGARRSPRPPVLWALRPDPHAAAPPGRGARKSGAEPGSVLGVGGTSTRLLPQRCPTVFGHGPASGSSRPALQGVGSGRPGRWGLCWSPSLTSTRSSKGVGGAWETEAAGLCATCTQSPIGGASPPSASCPPLVLAARGGGPARGPQRHGNPE